MLTLRLLTLVSLLTLGGSVPLLSIQSPDGDLVDCIRREEQHAFQHPLLREHQILDLPSGMSHATEVEDEYGWQVWHGNGTRCPLGSVPLRRIVSRQKNETSGLSSEERATQGHEYAEGRTVQYIKVYGTQVTMNVWHPKIDAFNEFSLGQTWVTSGSYKTDDLNTLEAGWQVYPFMYDDDRPRFFTLWTTDAYNEKPCYNTDCPGFVQISQTVMVGGAIDKTSVLGGEQMDLTIRIWIDLKQECWWLGVAVGQGALVPVGYWPTTIFTRLRHHAEVVKWGGEIVNNRPMGQHTRTEMGSGYFPEGGYRKAAYMRNLEIAMVENVFQPIQTFGISSTVPQFYRSGVSKTDRPDFGAHFYYGGPYPAHAIASQSSWDMAFALLCFGVFWLV